MSGSRIAVALRQFGVMTLKEIRQLLRDRVLLGFIVYLFTLNIVLAGSSESHELHSGTVVVHDADHSAASRDLIYRFREPYFRFAGEVPDPREGMRRLEAGEALVYLDIPQHFQRDLRRGVETVPVQLLVDTSKATRGYLAASYSARIMASFNSDWTGSRSEGESLPRIEARSRMWFNPDLNEPWFFSISELLTMLTVACVLLPASAMVREKERGTIEQLLVSPLTPLQVMLPKVAAMVGVMMLGTAISLLGIMQPLFHVPIRGSVGLFFLMTGLFAFTNAGLGLMAATFARNAGQVGMLLLLIVMPLVVLSGTWTPMESLPPALRQIMLLSPLRHFIQIAYGILLRGAGLDTLWDSALAMVLLGGALLAIGAGRFRRQFR
jgi:ABC-2 type transport system permease protein